MLSVKYSQVYTILSFPSMMDLKSLMNFTIINNVMINIFIPLCPYFWLLPQKWNYWSKWSEKCILDRITLNEIIGFGASQSGSNYQFSIYYLSNLNKITLTLCILVSCFVKWRQWLFHRTLMRTKWNVLKCICIVFHKSATRWRWRFIILKSWF